MAYLWGKDIPNGMGSTKKKTKAAKKSDKRRKKKVTK